LHGVGQNEVDGFQRDPLKNHKNFGLSRDFTPVIFHSKERETAPAALISNLVRDYVDKADIGKRGACHLFRHSMATLMLENGADIQMLGHADLNSTQIYTHVSIQKLKQIHTATHPAKLDKSPSKATSSNAEDEEK
jgi:integrase/recombinase XerD